MKAAAEAAMLLKRPQVCARRPLDR